MHLKVATISQQQTLKLHPPFQNGCQNVDSILRHFDFGKNLENHYPKEFFNEIELIARDQEQKHIHYDC